MAKEQTPERKKRQKIYIRKIPVWWIALISLQNISNAYIHAAWSVNKETTQWNNHDIFICCRTICPRCLSSFKHAVNISDGWYKRLWSGQILKFCRRIKKQLSFLYFWRFIFFFYQIWCHRKSRKIKHNKKPLWLVVGLNS